MDQVVLLTLMATFTLVAGLCSILFNRLKLPPLIGYLVAGIIIANVWTTTSDWEFVVSTLSSIGLVMLMFSIGMEIDLTKIRVQGVFAMKIAMIQLPMLVIGGMLLGPALGFNFIQSVALGAIISGSSTAVVLAVLKSQAKLDLAHIDLLILITIMEDIGQVIILTMITPLLAGMNMEVNGIIVMIVSIVVFMSLSLMIGLKLMPRILDWISDNVTTEVLVIFSIGLAFGMALLSMKVGLSMAIGAFLMGMMISPCKSTKVIVHQIEPMKNLFMAMFFISVGMEINLAMIPGSAVLIVEIFAIFAILKIATVFLAYWVCDADGKTSFLSAVSLVAMGEFAFIIAKEAYGYGVIPQSVYTAVIGAALVSMMALPILTRCADPLWDKCSARSPAPMRRIIGALNKVRSDVYAGINASSKKTQETFRKGMTHVYINILLIVFIQIGFCWSMPTASQWLLEVFGGYLTLWEILLVVANLLILIPLTALVINNTKFLSRIITTSSEQMSRFRTGDTTLKTARFFQDINTYTLTLAIDFTILLIVPNPLGLLEHLIVLGITLVLMYLIYLKAGTPGMKGAEAEM